MQVGYVCFTVDTHGIAMSAVMQCVNTVTKLVLKEQWVERGWSRNTARQESQCVITKNKNCRQ